jgi:hypothetical protein
MRKKNKQITLSFLVRLVKNILFLDVAKTSKLLSMKLCWVNVSCKWGQMRHMFVSCKLGQMRHMFVSCKLGTNAAHVRFLQIGTNAAHVREMAEDSSSTLSRTPFVTKKETASTIRFEKIPSFDYAESHFSN